MNTATDTTFDGLDDFDSIAPAAPSFLQAAATYAQRPSRRRRSYGKPAPASSAPRSSVEQKLANFTAEHSDVIEWVMQRVARSSFASSLAQGMAKYGSLTEGQVAAVRRIMAEDSDRAEQRAKAAPAAAAPRQQLNVAGAGFVSLGAALLKAKASGLKRPAIIFPAVTFKLAKDGGANTGSLYASSGKAYGSAYFGKINQAGDFSPARDCTPEIRAAILAICADPLGQIVAHGQKTGNCACCGRELTDAESVARGIGPVCFERYFG
jgi:hypothetical protein